MKRWGAFAGVVTCLLASGAMAGEKPSIAVLDFRAKGGVSQDTADSLADLVASAIQTLGQHKVIGKSDIQSMIGFEQVKDRLGCDDAGCLAEIGGALGVNYILAGNVGKIGSTFLLNLRLIDPRKAEVSARVSRKVTGGEDGLIDAVPQAVAEMFGEGAASARTIGETRTATSAPAPSRVPAPREDLVSVKIETNVNGAEIYVDDRLVGRAPLQTNLSRGRHKFEAKHKTHQPAKKEITIDAAQVIKLGLAMNEDATRREVEKALDKKMGSEFSDYMKSDELKSGVTFAEYTHSSARSKRNWGIGLVFGVMPAMVGIGVGSWFALFLEEDSKCAEDEGSCDMSGSTGAIAVFTVLGFGSLVSGIVLWAIGQGDMTDLEPHLPHKSASKASPIRFLGVAPLMDSNQRPQGLSLGFQF